MSTTSKSNNYSSEDDNNEIRRGPWTPEDDDLLTKYIAKHGEGRWNLLAINSGLRRTGKSCRLRWLNYLKPDIKRGNLTSEEQLLIFELHSMWGNRWSKIAQQLPGRTDNEIKNYWRTRIQKQSTHLKHDTGRTGFAEFVNQLRMTRCLQRAKESYPSTMSIQNQAIPLPLDGVPHYSAIGTIPTQFITSQKAFVNDVGGENSLDKNGSCMSSSESAISIQNMTQPFGYTDSDFGINAYDAYDEIDAFNLTTTMVADDHEYCHCQVSESNCLNREFACSSWNIDESWQFRNI